MTANTYDNDRETLSALFDGELSGDAARFALKRLGHDEQWRDAFGRWQLCGDVLRGQATAVASGDFAQRVASVIAREHVPAMSQPVPKAALFSGRRGWMGGALAASVAVAALFVARPLTNGSTPVAPDATQAQVAEASSVRLNAAPEVQASKTPSAPDPSAPDPSAPDPSAPDPAVDLGTAAVAAAEVPRRAIERRNSRSQSQRAALRASARREPAAVAVAASAAPATATTALAADVHTTTANVAASANPFQPRPNEAVARPWPRAVLPQYSSQGGINASYSGASSSGTDSPSFYPFEPSMPQEAAQATVERNPPPH
jgi:Meckel syndrome type 1 protein